MGPLQHVQALKKSRGQSTVEYILMVAFGAIFSIQITRFFNGVFEDGIERLHGNIEQQTATGAGFRR